MIGNGRSVPSFLGECAEWSSHVSSPVCGPCKFGPSPDLECSVLVLISGPKGRIPLWFRRIGLGWGSGDPRGLGDLAGIGALCGQVDLETWLVLELGDMEGREGS